MENNKQKDEKIENKSKVNSLSYLIAFIILAIFFFLIWNGISGIFNSSTESGESKEPGEIELMTYAQMVLKDNLSNPNYSSYKGDYEFIGTGLRRKIEGKVNNKKFYMIIEFVDDTYEDFDLISLQVGNDIIYKK